MQVKYIVKAKGSWSVYSRAVVRSVVEEAIEYYGLGNDEVQLVVKLIGCRSDYGSMATLVHGKKIQIWLSGGYSIKRIISTTFHEMTHVKQALRDGFMVGVENTVFWKHKERAYDEEKDYWTAPWEVDARRMEKKLTKWYLR